MVEPAPCAQESLLSLEELHRLPDDGVHRLERVRGRVVREPPPNDEHGWLNEKLGRSRVSAASGPPLRVVKPLTPVR